MPGSAMVYCCGGVRSVCGAVLPGRYANWAVGQLVQGLQADEPPKYPHGLSAVGAILPLP